MDPKARDDSVLPVCSQNQAQRATQLQTDAAMAGVHSPSSPAVAHVSPHEADA